MSALLQAALDYAQRGWAVLPLHSIVDGKCTCSSPPERCKPGKHPRTPHGLKDATKVPSMIEGWWTKWPNANIGIVTGAESFTVLDVDPKNGGDLALAELVAEHSPLPDTPLVQTGSGGQHYYFRAVPELGSSASKLGPGLDIKSEGGYVVAPPSLHQSGRLYTWELSSTPDDMPFAEVPDWMLRRLQDPMPSAKGTSGPTEEMPAEGARNSTLTSEVGKRFAAGWSEKDALRWARGWNLDLPKPLPGPEVVSVVTSIAKAEARRDERDEDVAVVQWPMAAGDRAFHGLAGRFVRAIEPHTEADPHALLVQLLVAFGNAVGRPPHCRAEADRHGLNLFACLVGVTSKGRKGASWGHVRAMAEFIDPAWKQSCIQSGLSSGEGLIYAIRDEVLGMEKVTAQDQKSSKKMSARNEVVTDPGVSDKRALWVESEFSSTLKVLARDGNTLSAKLREAWDGTDLRVATRNSPLRASNPHVSLITHVTKFELMRYLSESDAAGGTGNRFLWVCVKRSKELPEGGSVSRDVLDDLGRHLEEALTFGKTVGLMQRDEAARRLWRSTYHDLSEGKPGMLGAMTGRAEAQVSRLSCIYALLDKSATVRVEHLQAALELWRYCEDSARFIFGDALGNAVADKILAALRATPSGLTRKDIRDLFERNKKSAEIALALTLLAGNGLARSESRPTSGRPEERWFYLGVTTKTTNGRGQTPASGGASVVSVVSANGATRIQDADPDGVAERAAIESEAGETVL